MSAEALEGQLLSKLTRTMHTHQLIREGDRVMVCLSGGKDSYTLLHLLELARRRWEFKFELVAVHLDQRQPGYDGAPLSHPSRPSAHCAASRTRSAGSASNRSRMGRAPESCAAPSA